MTNVAENYLLYRLVLIVLLPKCFNVKKIQIFHEAVLVHSDSFSPGGNYGDVLVQIMKSLEIVSGLAESCSGRERIRTWKS